MILGVSFSHNATACVIDDNGKILFCCSEERFSRRKNEWGFPYRTLDYIFNNIVTKEQISLVSVGELCKGNYSTNQFAEMMYLEDYNKKDTYIKNPFKLSFILGKEIISRMFNKKDNYRDYVINKINEYGLNVPVLFFNHHKSHAASAYYTSPFNDSLVITLDGEGDLFSGSIWIGKDSKLEIINYLPEVSSAGKFYRFITSLLGFRVNRHEGKITGLAAYGNQERFYKMFKELLNVENINGNMLIKSKIAEQHIKNFNLRNINLFKMSKNIFAYLKSNSWENFLNLMIFKQSQEFFKKMNDQDITTFDFQTMSDIAAAAQIILEETVVEYINYYVIKTGIKKLSLAGGVFANVKLNQRILEKTDVEDIYIHPGMGDEGLALGGAYAALYEEKKQKNRNIISTSYFGPEYDDSNIKSELKKFSLNYEEKNDKELAEIISDALVQEKIIGICRGKEEYGPRALGNRTILINPSKKEINDLVNKRLCRSEFMPFAPVVMQEYFEELFVSNKIKKAYLPSLFMTITVDVKSEWVPKIQGVVHIDNTARPQAISRNDNPLYYDIISEFHKKTGIPCLVNTSFNMHEEPIVNSPNDAIRSFKRGAVDILILGNCVVRSEN